MLKFAYDISYHSWLKIGESWHGLLFAYYDEIKFAVADADASTDDDVAVVVFVVEMLTMVRLLRKWRV